MKQKKYFILAAAAILMAACSENDIAEKQSPQVTAEDGAVVFDVYTSRATTRAGVPGEITTNGLKNSGIALGEAGFGVFAYYTNNGEYDNLQIPNLMYNQQVTYSGTAWTYTPIKYWPNEYGTTAESEDQDKVSFFAYAPWVEVISTSGKPKAATTEAAAELQKWGINSISRNSATGDPIVKYLVDFDPAHSVDLCWGVNDGTPWNKVLNGDKQVFNAGLPWLNVERPADAVSQKLKFTFKHALSKLNVQIDAFVDGINNANAIAEGTRVYVRSITFEGLAIKGALNLNNENANVAKWMDYNGTNDLVTGEAVTIYDGRKDGKEGTMGGEATNEKVLGLNPALVQTKVWKDDVNPGVTNTPVNLFHKWNGSSKAYEAAELNEPVYVIPTGDPVKVTIIYDIETADKGLATYVSDGQTAGSSIENVIYKSITFGGDKNKFENGKAYTLKLHLGMNSVKFDASVTDWEVQAANDVDLPSNIPSYKATTGDGTAATATVAADADSYTFAITELTPFETVSTSSFSGIPPFKDGPYSATANASGVAIVKVNLDKNTTVKDITNNPAIAFNAASSGKKVTLTVTQKAAPLGLTVSQLIGATKTFTLRSTTATGTDWGGLSSKTVTVLRNGVPVTPKTTTWKGEGADICDITLPDDYQLELGDVYTFTVEAGNAPKEVATANMGGIKYVNKAIDKHMGDSKFTNYLTIYGPITGITYESSVTATATIDSSGEVTIVAVGTTTITAKYTPINANGWFYLNAQDTYTLAVTAAP